MKRIAILMATVSLALTLCACSNPLKAASKAAESAIESTTTTNIVLSDASQVPAFVIYDPNDNTQVALSLTPYITQWYYLDADGIEQTISETAVSAAGTSDTATSSGDASGDSSSDTASASESASSGTAAASSDEVNALLIAADADLPTLSAEDSEIYYVVDTGATPDQLIQTSWKSDYIGDASADAMEIYTKLASFNTLPLKAGRVYQIDVTWEEENYESRGYYGTLTYLFITIEDDGSSASADASGDA